MLSLGEFLLYYFIVGVAVAIIIRGTTHASFWIDKEGYLKVIFIWPVELYWRWLEKRDTVKWERENFDDEESR